MYKEHCIEHSLAEFYGFDQTLLHLNQNNKWGRWFTTQTERQSSPAWHAFLIAARPPSDAHLHPCQGVDTVIVTALVQCVVVSLIHEVVHAIVIIVALIMLIPVSRLKGLL